MQDLKVGILQFDQVWQDKKSNFDRIRLFLADFKNLDLLLLPEMFHTGFSMDISYADDWNQSEGINFLLELSRQLNLAIYTSIMVKDGHYYNRGVFVLPDGQIHTYDKRKSFSLGGENLQFSSGNVETIVSYKNWKFNLQICYDLRFPELVRSQLNEDGSVKYDVLLYVANWPQTRIQHWDILLGARAIENQCYVVSCNRVGIDGNGLLYNGHSQALDLLGTALILPPEHEGLFEVTLNYQHLQDTRKRLPFLKDA